MNRYSKALRILNPKGQVEDKPLMAVKIVKGEHYSRPVMEKEIQEYIQKTFKKSNQYRYRKDNWLETLVEEKQTEFDRKEIEKEIKLRRLYEQMTTKGMMVTKIEGEGETDLDSLDGSVATSYSPLSGESSAFSNTAITASGTGSGSDGGFDLGQDYLGFNGGSEYQVRYAALDAIDSTEIDTIVITAIRGNDANGGEDPDAEDEDLNVWYQIGDAAPAKIGIIIPVGSDDGGLKNWSLHIPQEARNAATKFILRQETHHGVGFDNYGVTEIKFQRRGPMNVFVSLDSPAASSFIRTGGGGTTEKDKKKKVQDILDGSDAYLENQFGEDFPGTSPREVGQEEPQPGIGKFEPEVIDYETWKNELEKSDDPEAKKILKGDPKKTFDEFEKDQEKAMEYDPNKKYKVGDKVIKDGKVRYFDGFGWSDKPPAQAQAQTATQAIKQIENAAENITYDSKGLLNLFDVITGPLQALLNLSGIVGDISPTHAMGLGKLNNSIAIFRGVTSGRIVDFTPNSFEMDRFVKNLGLMPFSNQSKKTKTGYMPITTEEIPYSDENIWVDKYGNINNNKESGLYPDQTVGGDFAGMKKHGSGFGQLVIPSDGGVPYVKYIDYNYHNLNQPTEASEVFIRQMSELAHLLKDNKYYSMLGGATADSIIRLLMDTPKVIEGMKSEVGLPGWPAGIHGAALTDFEVPLDKLPQETQDMITSHPLYMTDERVEEIVKDDKKLGETMGSMWEKDEKLFKSALDEVEEYPEHQKLQELENTIWGFKREGDEGHVPFTWKYSSGKTEDRSHLVLSNMSPLWRERQAPVHALKVKYYGIAEHHKNSPSDYIDNDGEYWRDPHPSKMVYSVKDGTWIKNPNPQGGDKPIGAPGSRLRQISQPYLDLEKPYNDHNDKYGTYISKGFQKYKDADSETQDTSAYKKWREIYDKQIELGDKLWDAREKATKEHKRMQKEISNLDKKLEGVFNNRKEQLEKAMDPLIPLLQRDFIKLFTLQHFKSKYKYIPSDDYIRPDGPGSSHTGSTKGKDRLSGSAGEIAGVDAATAASTAAQTQSRRKKKGGTQIAYGGYSIEDQKNIINLQKKYKKDPKYKPNDTEMDSLKRQYGLELAHYKPKGNPLMEKEIREYVKKTFKKSNQYRYRKDNWLETLVEEKQIEFDRKEIEKEIKLRRLYEQMTTAGMMTTLLQGEGDVDLENVTQTAIPGTEGAGGSGGSYSFGNYDAYGAAGFWLYLDTTKYDTLTFNVNAGNATKIEYTINGPPFRTLSSGTNSITISAADRGSSTSFLFNAQKSGGSGSSGASISGTAFQRRAPMNAFVSLDSPEASSFIRTGGDEEKDKKKKVQDMLDASDAYLENQFGSDFPGTSPREVGQESEVIDYETWKNELEKSDDPEAQKILKGDSKKTFDGYQNDTQIAGRRTGSYSNKPSSAEIDAKNMKYDPHMKMWVPNIPKAQQNNKGDTQIAQRMVDTKVKIGGQEYNIRQPEKPGKTMYDKHMKGGVPTIRKAKTNKKNKYTKIPSYDVAHYEPKGNPLMEKKKFDAVEPKEHKSGSKRIKSPKQFFNPDDVKPEFPKDPPPEMVNGWHPNLADGQEIANRFNKLDPQSAKAMPKTGNPYIDAKVEKAKNNPDKDGPEWRKMVDAKARKARLQRG